MGFYSDVLLPHCLELGCGLRVLVPERQKITAGLQGRVLEIGFGSGLNLPYLPSGVSRVLAVDPSERARKIGAQRITQTPCPVEFVGLDAQAIQADSASADTALSTFTMCTVPDVATALREVKRILKPGGRLFFLEHGRAPDARVAHWQNRLNPLQRAAFGGCNLNRDIPALVRAAGFEFEGLEAYYLPGTPKTHGYLFAGSAVPA